MLMKSRLPGVLCPLLTAVPLIAQIDNPATDTAFIGTWFRIFQRKHARWQYEAGHGCTGADNKWRYPDRHYGCEY